MCPHLALGGQGKIGLLAPQKSKNEAHGQDVYNRPAVYRTSRHDQLMSPNSVLICATFYCTYHNNLSASASVAEASDPKSATEPGLPATIPNQITYPVRTFTMVAAISKTAPHPHPPLQR